MADDDCSLMALARVIYLRRYTLLGTGSSYPNYVEVLPLPILEQLTRDHRVAHYRNLIRIVNKA